MKQVSPLHVAPFFGLGDSVCILNDNGHDVNEKGSIRGTALHWVILRTQHPTLSLRLGQALIQILRETKQLFEKFPIVGSFTVTLGITAYIVTRMLSASY